MAVKALDSLLALKLINFIEGLRPSDRRVLALIIEHFNRKTDRCDPGLDRLAALLRLSRRTVIRSVQRLEAARLLKKIRHGGLSHRNRYEPNWARFSEFERIWNQQFGRSANARRAELSPSKWQRSHIDGDSPVIQTCKANPHKQTYRDYRSGTGTTFHSPGSRDVAAIEAERRWTAELHRRFRDLPITYGEIIEAIDLTTQAAATDAELKRRGAGIEFIFRHLKLGKPKDVRHG